MHLKALTAILIVAVFASGFISTAQAKALSQPTTTNSKFKVAVTKSTSQSNQPKASTVTSVSVSPGETLSSIATQNNTTFVRLFDANSQIANPDLIFAKESIVVPTGSQVLPDRYDQFEAAQVASQVSQPTTVSSQVVQAVPTQVVATDTSVWTELAQCESGGNWSIDTGNGFYGGLQFTLSSWEAVGGTGLPSAASASEQIALAQKLQAEEGWGAWPVCSAKLGL